MKKMSITLSLMACVCAVGHAQPNVPSLLLRVAHCLKIKGFLPSSNTGKLDFGYLVDAHSYPGEKLIYVIAYASPSQSNGWIFSVFQTENIPREVLNIQNNARFALSRREPIGVSFITPPLGGDWTQEHLASAIREIENQPRFTVSVDDLSATDSSACKSYTDSDRNQGR